jgi:hypothetical protein
MHNFAHLKTDSPWYPIFDRGMAPIKNILIPRTGYMEGGGGMQEFYDLDWDSCTPQERVLAGYRLGRNGYSEGLLKSQSRDKKKAPASIATPKMKASWLRRHWFRDTQPKQKDFTFFR